MILKDIMNPNRASDGGGCCLAETLDVVDISMDMISSDEDYIGVVNADGARVGAIRTDRLKYLIFKNQETCFEQILDHLNIGVIAIDTDSRIFYANQAYASILGVAPGKILGRYMNVIEQDALILQVLDTHQPIRRDKQLIKTVQKYVAVDMVPLYNKGVFSGACSMFTDITRINDLTNEVRLISEVAENYKQQIAWEEYMQAKHIIGESHIYQMCIQKAMKVAGTDATVLIRGENGTGKEVISRVIQENSLRKGKPFVKINCAAIPEALMESEFFGYEDGAFTGARKGGRDGKFELADGGTIFLDEVGDIPLPMQAKLLRVLQEGEIEKIGANRPIPVNVRVIAATNQPLEQMIRDNRFRMDLYYRLNVVNIEIPSLRQRGQDIRLLANEFLNQFNEKYGMMKKLSQSAYLALMKYDWPGNVRELRNMIESAVVLSTEDIITARDFAMMSEVSALQTSGPEYADYNDSVIQQLREAGGLDAMLRDYERQLIKKALDENGGVRNQTMIDLHLSRRTFYRKLSELNIN